MTEWNQYEKLVLSKLDTLDENYKTLHVGLEELRLEQVRMQSKLSMKATLVGFLGGFLPALALLIYHLLGA